MACRHATKCCDDHGLSMSISLSSWWFSRMNSYEFQIRSLGISGSRNLCRDRSSAWGRLKYFHVFPVLNTRRCRHWHWYSIKDHTHGITLQCIAQKGNETRKIVVMAHLLVSAGFWSHRTWPPAGELEPQLHSQPASGRFFDGPLMRKPGMPLANMNRVVPLELQVSLGMAESDIARKMKNLEQKRRSVLITDTKYLFWALLRAIIETNVWWHAFETQTDGLKSRKMANIKTTSETTSQLQRCIVKCWNAHSFETPKKVNFTKHKLILTSWHLLAHLGSILLLPL